MQFKLNLHPLGILQQKNMVIIHITTYQDKNLLKNCNRDSDEKICLQPGLEAQKVENHCLNTHSLSFLPLGPFCTLIIPFFTKVLFIDPLLCDLLLTSSTILRVNRCKEVAIIEFFILAGELNKNVWGKVNKTSKGKFIRFL